MMSEKIGWILSVVILHDLAFVMIYDAIAWINRTPTVSSIVRHSWLAWPVGILATITVGLVVLGHFVDVHR
jgi:hypothetical protein